MEEIPEFEELTIDTNVKPNSVNIEMNNRNPIDNEILDINTQKSSDIFILDKIIEKFHFSRFHYATLFVCIFTLTCDGYLIFHFKTSENTFRKTLGTSPEVIETLTILQLISSIVGSLLSTNCPSANWDASSNIFLGIVGLICTIMMINFDDPLLYSILIISYSICNGFISAISTNFLIELFKLELRGALFLFVFSCRILGISLACLVFIIIFNNYHIEKLSLLMVGLFILQIGLCISLAFIMDSPRILYYNNHLSNFYQYIQEITTEGKANIYNQEFKTQIMSKLEMSRKEIELNYGKQSHDGFCSSHYYLWNKPILKITIKSIVFVLFSLSFFMNIRDSQLKIMKHYNVNLNDYIQYTDGEDYNYQANDVNTHRPFIIRFQFFLFYFLQFLICSGMAFVYYKFPNIKRLYLCFFCLIICALLLILILIIQNGIFYLVSLFEAFSFFYFGLVYLLFTEMSITKLRNYSTTIMFVMMNLLNLNKYIVQLFFSVNPILIIIFNILIFFALMAMEYYWIDHKNELRYKSLQQIEFEIIGENKIK